MWIVCSADITRNCEFVLATFCKIPHGDTVTKPANCYFNINWISWFQGVVA